MNSQDWSPSEWTGWISLQSKGLSRVFSNTTVAKHQFFDAQLSSQSILKEISPGCSLEGMMLRLKLQYFGHLMWRVNSLEKTLMLEGLGAGGKGDYRRWDGWMASLTRCTWVWVNSRSWWWIGRPGMNRFMVLQRVGNDWGTELKGCYKDILVCMSACLRIFLG